MKSPDSEAKTISDSPTQTAETSAAGAPPWRRLLVPVDFSASSDAALLYAVQLARVNGATLHVYHAIPYPHMLDVLFERGFAPEETVLRIRRKGRHHVRQLLASVGVDVALRFHFHEGETVAAILAWVDKFKPDLIVMGTHGHRGAARFFLGSVAEAVVRQAPCPVLTLRATQA
ncbi:MAG: universal stress protein [Deltaproteobacteria bacterium]|nr:universal stress protein [Deltaproteobacteria bacterium]